MTRTTVFQSGNSQAVRLPKAFRFKSTTVEIFRRGDEVVLRERAPTLGEALASLPPLDPSDAEVFDLIRDTRPAEERDWSALGADAAPRRPQRGR